VFCFSPAILAGDIPQERFQITVSRRSVTCATAIFPRNGTKRVSRNGLPSFKNRFGPSLRVWQPNKGLASVWMPAALEGVFQRTLLFGDFSRPEKSAKNKFSRPYNRCDYRAGQRRGVFRF
jgi:hypothetical protein